MEDPSIVQLRALATLRANGQARQQFSRAEKAANWQALARLRSYINHDLSAGVSPIDLVHPGGHQLTHSGLALSDLATIALDAVDAFKGAIVDMRNQSASVSISCLPAQSVIVARASERLKDARPPIDLDLRAIDDSFRRDSSQHLLNQVRQGELDLALVSESSRTVGVHFTHLYTWQLVAVTRRTNSDTDDAIDAAELEVTSSDKDGQIETMLLTSPEGHHSHQLIDSLGLTLPTRIESASVEALVSLASQGFGTAVIAGDSLPLYGAIGSKRLSCRAITTRGAPLTGEIYVAHRPLPDSNEVLTRVLDCLQSVTRQWAHNRRSRFVSV